MAGKEADWPRIQKMAERIHLPNYGINEFFHDCVSSFPELGLFFDCDDDDPVVTSSGLAAETEYQRTIGALFTVYWLLRLDSDGKQCYCYGYKEAQGKYVPMPPPENIVPV